MSGQIDLSKLSLSPSMMAKVKARDEELRKHMSPPGALGLPDLLDKRRLEYGIPDDVFKHSALFDRIFVWQVPPGWAAGETFGGTSIVMPETVKQRKQNEAPIGIVVAAGLIALDNLRSNGIDLGHLVTFVRLSPWRMPVGMIGAEESSVMLLRDGDLCSSFDLQENLRAGKVRFELDGISCQHVFVDEKGFKWARREPLVSEDV